jgi:hypothetical protein
LTAIHHREPGVKFPRTPTWEEGGVHQQRGGKAVGDVALEQKDFERID